MNKSLGVAATVVVLAGGGWVGASYWSGVQAERWYQQSLAEVAGETGITLNTLRYTRGLFSSEVVTQVLVAAPAGSETGMPDSSFSVRQQIYHGPLPLAAWAGVPGAAWAPGAAVVRTTLQTDEQSWTGHLARWYGGQEPLVALSRVGFDGSSVTEVSMPPLQRDQIEELKKLDFSGLQGHFEAAAQNTAVKGTLIVERLSFTAPATAEGQAAPGDVQFALRGLSSRVDQRKGAFNLMFGESGLRVDEIRLQEPGEAAPLVLTGLDMVGDLQPQDAKQVSGGLRVTAGKISLGQKSGTGSLRVALRNIDGATAEQLQQWQRKLAHKPDDPALPEEGLGLLRALLEGNPVFSLDTEARLDAGEWRGNLTLNFQNPGELDPMQGPLGLLDALAKGTAEIAASQGLVETVLTDMGVDEIKAQAAIEGTTPSETALHDLAVQQTQQQLQGLTATGYLRLDAGQYKATARFEGGKLFVNGQEIPLLSAADAEAGTAEQLLNEDEAAPGAEEPAPAPTAPAQNRKK